MNKSEVSAEQMGKLRNAKLKLVRKELGTGRVVHRKQQLAEDLRVQN